MESGVPARMPTCKALHPRMEAREKLKDAESPCLPPGELSLFAGHCTNEIQKKSVSTARSEEAALLSEPNT